MLLRFSLRRLAVAILVCAGPVFGKTPVEYANPLVGTASLDDPALLGNAPPPGEEGADGSAEASGRNDETFAQSGLVRKPVRPAYQRT